MRFGKWIEGYLLVGVLFIPLVYWNNANGYRAAGTSAGIGAAFTGAVFFWPSYLFSIEPELDGDSREEFADSFREVLEYRNSKWFAGAGNKKYENLAMMTTALGACIMLFDTEHRFLKGDAWNQLKGSQDPYMKAIEKKVLDQFDGEDFSGMVKEGYKCDRKAGR